MREGRGEEGGLQVYILVSEIVSKNTCSNFSITIIILETVKFLNKILKTHITGE